MEWNHSAPCKQIGSDSRESQKESPILLSVVATVSGRMSDFLRTITGSFCSPAADNPTIALMEAAFSHHRLPWVYLNCEVPDGAISQAVAGALAMGWRGFNCSMPHKQTVIPELHTLALSARIIGAVNCVVNDDGELTGHNTDGRGFIDSLDGVIDVRGARIVILGAGGAARAIAVEAALGGAAHLTLVNRNPTRAQDVADAVSVACEGVGTTFRAMETEYAIPAQTDLLVQATSIGLSPNVDEMPSIQVTSLHPNLVVADVIPNPAMTRLLRVAAERGCRTVTGTQMLINQAIANLELWSGIRADAAVMLDAFAAALVPAEQDSRR